PLARAGVAQRDALLQGPAQLAGPLFESGSTGDARPEDGLGGAAPPQDVPSPHPAPPGSAPPADRRFTLVHSLYWLTSNISNTGPIALVVDDCHWADAPSLRFLAYVSARADELGGLVMLT